MSDLLHWPWLLLMCAGGLLDEIIDNPAAVVVAAALGVVIGGMCL